jgi:hypothetical protein
VELFFGVQAAGAARGIAVFHAEVFHLQAADGNSRPAILVAVIVDAAGLAGFPADGDGLEESALENQVARVAALGKKQVGLKRFGLNFVAADVVGTRWRVKSLSGIPASVCTQSKIGSVCAIGGLRKIFRDARDYSGAPQQRKKNARSGSVLECAEHGDRENDHGVAGKISGGIARSGGGLGRTRLPRHADLPRSLC